MMKRKGKMSIMRLMVFENTALQYPDGIVTVEKEKKGFIKSIFPTKGDSGKEKARKSGFCMG